MILKRGDMRRGSKVERRVMKITVDSLLVRPPWPISITGYRRRNVEDKRLCDLVTFLLRYHSFILLVTYSEFCQNWLLTKQLNSFLVIGTKTV